MKRNQGEDYIRDTAKIDYPKQIRINFCTCSDKSKVSLEMNCFVTFKDLKLTIYRSSCMHF
jgi:hypothetical protein